MNFKKHISLFLAFFLLVSNMGMAFTVHYCDDEVASIALNTASNSVQIEKDCCGKVEKESKCCKTKLIKSQEKSDQVIAKSISFTTDTHFLITDWQPIVFTSKFNFKKSHYTSYYCDANAPPLYLLYSQYTFYA